MAFLGIVIVAVNLRTAVAAISPIVAEISVDIDLDNVGLGIIGALPAVAFALSGVFGASLARRVGLERLTVISILAMVAGHVLRATAGSYALLLLGSVIAFAGIGITNILLPPLVKRYFPDRIGFMTTAYASVMSIGTAVPAALAAPIADSAGWRVSLGIWAFLAVVSLVPWIVVLVQHHRAERIAGLDQPDDDAPDVPQSSTRFAGKLTHSRTAWAISVIFALSSFNAYGMFAWLPQLLMDRAGSSAVEAGTLLAVFSLAGLPTAIIVPVLVARLRDVNWIVQAGVVAFIAGYLGLLLIPSFLTWLWVVLAGLGPLLFPAALVLINLRTRTQGGSVALSGFVQGFGYAVGACGPLLIGVLHQLTDDWTAPLVLLLVFALVGIGAGIALRRPAFVEDELAHTVRAMPPA